MVQEGEDDEAMREAAGDLASSSAGAVVGLEECLEGTSFGWFNQTGLNI